MPGQLRATVEHEAGDGEVLPYLGNRLAVDLDIRDPVEEQVQKIEVTDDSMRMAGLVGSRACRVEDARLVTGFTSEVLARSG